MGTAGSLGGELRTAIRTGSFEAALRLARSLPRLDLIQALELTILAAEKAPDRYEAMARRWLSRLLVERDLDPTQTSYAIAALREISKRPDTADAFLRWARQC